MTTATRRTLACAALAAAALGLALAGLPGADGAATGDAATPGERSYAPVLTTDEPESGAAAHLVPLFPSAADAWREGFVRVINRSAVAGEVAIAAIDDAGRRAEQVTLAVGASEAVHFNSHDLEQGNPDKGLSGGAGTSGEGDWRLEFSSALDIEVLAYVRAADGFLTAMHDVVERGPDGHRVAIFNPGRNRNQASLLRLINPGAEEAVVTITGIDDAGVASAGAVTVTLPAGGAATVAAAALESAHERGDSAADAEGASPLTGALGAGTGKWQLRVTSEQPVVVMSLLMSPTGHLTNLSTAPYRSVAAGPVIRAVAENTEGGAPIGDPVTVDLGAAAVPTHRLEGADAEAFAVDAASGQLRTREGTDYNFEAKAAYALTVVVADGLGGVIRIPVTVEVTDEDEPPAKPGAPEVEGSSSRSVLVRWEEPANRGPAITDYDVDYRRPGAAEYTDAEHEGVGREIEITHLRQRADYEFRVRASNDEGTGEWSEPTVGRGRSGGGGSGGGTTPPPPDDEPLPPPGNEPPVFEGDTGFSVAENVLAVGTVRASDPDDGDEITGFALAGGADAALFEVTGGGLLSFRTAPDFERPGDAPSSSPANEYVFEVEARSGVGDRAAATAAAVTVGVTDVDEPPHRPDPPTIGAATMDSLRIGWRAPVNTGPDITGYDYRHRAEGSGQGWTEATVAAAVTEATLTGLAQRTDFEVQVRAGNAEGTGAWSPSGRGATGPNGPDLEVGAATVSNSSPETEASFTLSAAVSNRGGASAAATTLHYYRSADATISASDIEVGTDAVEALSASRSSPESIDLTAPSTADTYYYGACVDAVTGESSATNNCSSSAQVDVTEPPPPSNRSPEPVGQIASRTLEAGGSQTLDVSSYFNDADSDELAYAAASSDRSVATARASGSAVTVTAVASGEAVVTVTASDPGGLTAEQGIAVTVAAENRPPIATKTIPGQTIHVWGELQTLPSPKNRFVVNGIHNYFSDPDGDPLQYGASSSDERYATMRTSIIPALDHYRIVVDPVAVGQATITLTATDPEGLNANYVFGVNVSPPLPNRRPVVQWPIGTRQVYVGVPDVLRLRDHFRDEDVYGSYFQLNYAVSSADNGIALVRVWDKRDHETGHGYARLVIEGVSAGETTATVVATDRAGLSVRHTFNIIAETRRPRVTRRISDVLVSAGIETYVRDLNSYFTDPDGYDLVYGASSSDTVVVRATISRHGPYVVLRAGEVGTADIAVTATDVTGLTASQTFTVTVVSPRPPTITRRISDRSVYVGRETYVYSLQNYFADPEGRELVYDASSSDTSVVRASVGEDNPYIVVLFAREVGTADVTVTATDVTGLTASQTFTVTVSAAASGGRGFSDSRPM